MKLIQQREMGEWEKGDPDRCGRPEPREIGDKGPGGCFGRVQKVLGVRETPMA